MHPTSLGVTASARGAAASRQPAHPAPPLTLAADTRSLCGCSREERIGGVVRGKPTRKQVIVGLALLVGALHFVTGPGYRGPFRAFVNGYLIDLLLPLVLYVLLSLIDRPVVLSRVVRSVIVLAIGVTVELLQFLGVPLFGRTFDPLDVVMYALGVAGGIVLEAAVLSRLEPVHGKGEPRAAA